MLENIISKLFRRQSEKIAELNSISVAASLANRDIFLPFKNCNEGKTVVLCGAGPTFSKYKPMDNVVHVAVNRALLNEKIKFDWFIADDWEGVYFFEDEVINYDCIKFIGTQVGGPNSRVIPESFCIKSKALRYYNDSYFQSNSFNGKFVFDIDRRPIAGAVNIALSAMQIVLYSHPSQIYLVGCDASANGHYKNGDKISDAQNKRFATDIKKSVGNDAVIDKWRELREFAKTYYPDTEIISINPVGLKGIFRDEYYD